MKKTKVKITGKIERVLLTEVLPYETPLIFNNRNFYELCCEKKNFFNNSVVSNFFSDSKRKDTIPFNFSISRNGQSPRILSVIHPSKQREIVEFYKEHKEAILYYASQSPFSIRKPIKVGRYYFDNNDKKLEEQRNKNSDNDDEIEDGLEIHGEEGIKFKNFFSYYRYGSVHKFYESHQYQECEKDFLHLCRFDIAKCFDSIYTHSIQWAIYTKEVVKKDIKLANDSFAGVLDKLMQSLNYNETHGIVIGPEFSRIFAEIILQRIDRSVYNALLKENILPNTDYRLFRYVDDHFLFFNDEKVKNRILDIYTLTFREYKMSINQAKTHQYSRPIMTEISMAKQKIRAYISKYVFPNQEAQQDKNIHKINANRTITNIKIFLRESGTDYEGVVQFLLGVIDSKIKSTKNSAISQDIGNILEIWELSSFFFSVHVSASSINRISLIAKNLLDMAEKLLLNEYFRLADRIFDSLEAVIKKLFGQDIGLYLLVILREKAIFTHKRIKPSFLEKVIVEKTQVTYFDVILLLFYMQDEDEYKTIKDLLQAKIHEKYKNIQEKYPNIFLHTEACLLFFDLLSCPFLDEKFKKQILEYYDIKRNKTDFLKFCTKNKPFFIQWEGFDLLEELEFRKSSETYT